jgi:hypothetical protein
VDLMSACRPRVGGAVVRSLVRQGSTWLSSSVSEAGPFVRAGGGAPPGQEDARPAAVSAPPARRGEGRRRHEEARTNKRRGGRSRCTGRGASLCALPAWPQTSRPPRVTHPRAARAAVRARAPFVPARVMGVVAESSVGVQRAEPREQRGRRQPGRPVGACRRRGRGGGAGRWRERGRAHPAAAQLRVGLRPAAVLCSLCVLRVARSGKGGAAVRRLDSRSRRRRALQRALPTRLPTRAARRWMRPRG